MSESIPSEPNYPEPQVFGPRPVFLVLPFGIAVVALAGIGWLTPIALLHAGPLLALVLMLGAFLNSGLILSREGIEWYALHTRWRFRKVPWDSVLDVRRGFFGVGNRIRLIVEFRRYEAWAWGTPQPDRQTEIEIWPTHLIGGDDVWDSIQFWRSIPERENSVATADETSAS